MSTRERAISDLTRIFTDNRIWRELAWIDIRSKYRLSTLGTFWITAATAVLAISIGILYGQFFNQDISSYLPYFATGFILWQFIAGAINETSNALIGAGNFVKGSHLPIVFHVLRVTQKQLIVLAHNAIVLIGIWAFFRWQLDIAILLSVVGLALTFVFISAISIVIAVACVRFRDIPPLIAAGTQFLFFATPVMWDPQQLRFGQLMLLANPITYFLIISRDPLIGRPVGIENWAIAIALTLAACAAAATVYIRYRARIAYWV